MLGQIADAPSSELKEARGNIQYWKEEVKNQQTRANKQEAKLNQGLSLIVHVSYHIWLLIYLTMIPMNVNVHCLDLYHTMLPFNFGKGHQTYKYWLYEVTANHALRSIHVLFCCNDRIVSPINFSLRTSLHPSTVSCHYGCVICMWWEWANPPLLSTIHNTVLRLLQRSRWKMKHRS